MSVDRCAREHLLVTVTTEDGEVLVHVFAADAEECDRLEELSADSGG